MKVKILYSISIFVLFVTAETYAQRNTSGSQSLNVKTNALAVTSDQVVAPNDTTTMPTTLDFNCATVFWTIDNSSNIKQWNLSAGQVTGGTIILQALNSMGLSFANSAFYSASNSVIKKYTDAAGWTTINLPPTVYASNNGGFGNHQYFTSSSTLYHYDGTSFSQIATFDSNSQMVLADIAVDSLGRAWIFQGSDGSVASKIGVYDSNGFVTEYPFSISTNFGYGSFFINDILYIAFGNNFQTHANQIVPILVNNGVATEGTPISFVYNGYHDLASCNSAANLNTNSPSFNNGLIVSPNPAKDLVSIFTNENVNAIEIFDMLGKLVITSYNEKFADISELKSGIYLIKIKTDDAVITKQLLKE